MACCSWQLPRRYSGMQKMPGYLGAEPGITMVLRTLGQDLSFHPHVHSIVSADGFDGKCWIDAKSKSNRFLFLQKSMASMFKAHTRSLSEGLGNTTCPEHQDIDKEVCQDKALWIFKASGQKRKVGPDPVKAEPRA